MDLMNKAELQGLMAAEADPSVSIYLPTHRAGKETEQDPIRFKNLLREVENRLAAQGIRSTDVTELLAPAAELIDNRDFWQHQSDGLAILLSRDEFHTYRMPIPFDELIVISDRFHLKPLLPLFTDNGRFYILALSQNEVRLLEGTKYTVEELDIEDIPASLSEAMQYDNFQKQLQFHTGTSQGGGERAAMYFGHESGDEKKGQILRWFHKINDELPGLLESDRAPLVLAGVEYLHPIYKEANSYPGILEEGVTGNPEELRPEGLHAAAWPIVQDKFRQAQEQAIERYQQLVHQGQATQDVSDVLIAAHNGQVDVLLVAIGEQAWGEFDPSTQSTTFHDDQQVSGSDLLDLAVVETLANGGSVYALEREEMPDRAAVAAILRY